MSLCQNDMSIEIGRLKALGETVRDQTPEKDDHYVWLVDSLVANIGHLKDRIDDGKCIKTKVSESPPALPHASSSLHDALSAFLGEVRGIADLIIAASDHEGFHIDDVTYLHVAQGLYERAGDFKKQLDGGES